MGSSRRVVDEHLTCYEWFTPTYSTRAAGKTMLSQQTPNIKPEQNYFKTLAIILFSSCKREEDKIFYHRS